MRHLLTPRPCRLISVGVFVLLMLLYMYNPAIERYAYKLSINKGSAWTAMRPAGEIVSDFSLKQKLTVTQTDLAEREFDNPICLEIQFVNYGNRINTGHFEVRVTTAGKSEAQILEARHIRDNSLEVICFDNILFEDLHNHEAWLEILGIDGQPRRSVSAVLSTFPEGSRAEVQGKLTNETLAVYLAIKKDPEHYQIIAYVLLALSAMLMTLLMFATWSLSEKRPSNAG